MDATPPSIWHMDVAAEVRRVDDCTRDEPCLRADDAHHQHEHEQHDHEHVPEVVEPPPVEDPPPGRQMLGVQQRAWREQAEENWRRAVQIMLMMNRNASTD